MFSLSTDSIETKDGGRRTKPPNSSFVLRPPSFVPRSSYTLAIIVGIFLLGLALRFYCLDCHGFWGDEIDTLSGAQLGIPGIFTERFGFLRNQTPLHYLLIWLMSQPIDPTTSTVLVRLPSVLAGALTLLVVYGLGREMFGREQGLLAAFLLALSAIHLNYSQELRPYSMLVFLTTLSVYALLRAERTQSRRWWAAFAIITIANVLNAYVALTIAMPALAPYLAWALWKQWSRRREYPKGFSYALISFAAVAIGCALVLLDTLQTPRPSPDLSQYSLQTAVGSALELTSWFTRFGLDAQVERLLQLVLLLLALAGLYLAFRTLPEAGALCALFVVVPPIVLSVFGTTNVVFQRYALFSMAFYFLLISHALVSLLRRAADAGGMRAKGRSDAADNLLKVAAVAVAGVAIVPFIAGQYNYYTYDGNITLSYRPEYRSVASYLSSRAHPDDLIVFIDDPGLGYTITNYYWKSIHPAPAYDARDPRLFADSPKGDVYWVVSSENLEVLPQIASPNHGWTEITNFERVSIVKEAHPNGGIVESMDRMVRIWEGLLPHFQPVTTLRGCVYQGRGDTAQAIAAYKRAGTYFPVGDDYLQTAIGYDARNDDVDAWREALISKFWEPQRPQVHKWLAQKLAAEGYASESRVEESIAVALQSNK